MNEKLTKFEECEFFFFSCIFFFGHVYIITLATEPKCGFGWLLFRGLFACTSNDLVEIVFQPKFTHF